MADYSVVSVADKTLSGTTEDTVTLSQGGVIRIENRDTAQPLVCRIGTGTLSVGSDDCINVPPETADIIGTYRRSVTVRIVGNGNRYVIRAVPT